MTACFAVAACVSLAGYVLAFVLVLGATDTSTIIAGQVIGFFAVLVGMGVVALWDPGR
jgi:hypothetical protein